MLLQITIVTNISPLKRRVIVIYLRGEKMFRNGASVRVVSHISRVRSQESWLSYYSNQTFYATTRRCHWCKCFGQKCLSTERVPSPVHGFKIWKWVKVTVILFFTILVKVAISKHTNVVLYYQSVTDNLKQ